jgi:hypothetical protein
VARGIDPGIGVRQYRDDMELIRGLGDGEGGGAVVVVPTYDSVCWQRSPLNIVAREVDTAVIGTFLRLKALSTFFLRRRQGFVVLCTPQPEQYPEGGAAVSRKIQDAIIGQGLYALLRCMSLELAAKGVQTIFVNLTEESASDLARVIAWSSGPDNSYSTANRINW